MEAVPFVCHLCCGLHLPCLGLAVVLSGPLSLAAHEPKFELEVRSEQCNRAAIAETRAQRPRGPLRV